MTYVTLDRPSMNPNPKDFPAGTKVVFRLRFNTNYTKGEIDWAKDSNLLLVRIYTMYESGEINKDDSIQSIPDNVIIVGIIKDGVTQPLQLKEFNTSSEIPI